MRYSEKPLVGLIKECETTFRAKHAHRLNNDGAIVERWTSMLCFIEPCPAGRRKYIGGMTVVSFRRVAVVGDAKSGFATERKWKGKEFFALGTFNRWLVCPRSMGPQNRLPSLRYLGSLLRDRFVSPL